jgi:hypothetical protein
MPRLKMPRGKNSQAAKWSLEIAPLVAVKSSTATATSQRGVRILSAGLRITLPRIESDVRRSTRRLRHEEAGPAVVRAAVTGGDADDLSGEGVRSVEIGRVTAGELDQGASKTAFHMIDSVTRCPKILLGGVRSSLRKVGGVVETAWVLRQITELHTVFHERAIALMLLIKVRGHKAGR